MKTTLENGQHFISFLSDYGFKATFGNEKNTLFIRKALQALIKSEIPIAEVFFEKTDYMGITLDSRGSIFDIGCVDERGNSYIVEMQVADFEFFFPRMKYYSFHKLNSMVRKGNYSFDNLQRIYCIGILEKTIFFDNADYHNIGVIKNEYGYVMDNQTVYVTVELDKFRLTENDIITDLEKLLFIMKNLEILESKQEKPEFFEEDWISTALKELDLRSFSPEQMEYFERKMAQRGSEEYIMRKMKKSIKEMEIKNNEMEIKNNEMIKAMYKNGIDIQTIANINQKTEAEILAIINE